MYLLNDSSVEEERSVPKLGILGIVYHAGPVCFGKLHIYAFKSKLSHGLFTVRVNYER